VQGVAVIAMKRAHLAGVVAAVLLIVGGEAGAGCAWVLWAELKIIEMNEKNGAHAPEWQIDDAFTSRDACLAAVRRDIESRMAVQPAGTIRRNWSTSEPRQPGSGRTALDGGMIFILMSEDRIMERSYRCLPDTVDPRPRGKE
jgi:hypothetical protein